MHILLLDLEVTRKPRTHVFGDKPVQLVLVPLAEGGNRVVVKVVIVIVRDDHGIHLFRQLTDITGLKTQKVY